MEDIDDNLPTEGKRYYMSHSEFFYSDSEKEKLRKIASDINFYVPMTLSQLVCASNMENARKAVINQLEKEGRYLVTKCRIDYLIVGE